MQADPYDSMLQVLDSGIGGLGNERYNFSPTTDYTFGRSSVSGSPGQCLISISNYNFFNSADAKTLFPNSITTTNNISDRGAQQSMTNPFRYSERGVLSYPEHYGEVKYGKIQYLVLSNTNNN